MKYKTAFRLALRAVGVLVLCNWIPRLITDSLMLIARFWPGSDSTFILSWQGYFFDVVGDVIAFALGVYLLLGGKWIVNLAIPSNRPYCHECGYELTGNSTGRCPECGTANTHIDSMPGRHT